MIKVEILFWYFLNICGCLLSSENISYSVLLKHHLQLHINHCGEVALCDNETNYVESLSFVIPVPCCLPCSCLPTCGDHKNCCPAMWNNTEIIKDEEMLLLPKQVKLSGNETRIRPNFSGKITQNITIVNELKIGNSEIRAEDLADQNQTGDVLEKTEEELDLVTDTDHAHDLLHDSLMNLQGKMDPNHGFKFNVETVCIRPQIFYSPNIFLDSKAYMMVATCKPGYQNASIIQKCQSGMENKVLTDMIPITSSFSGLTYVNKYCLICNEIDTFSSVTVVDEWDAIIVGYSVEYWHRFVFDPNAFISNLELFKFGYGNLHFAPRNKTIAQQCMTHDITSCNQTGLWRTHNAITETICHHGYSLPVLHRINNENLLFKNIACVHCNSAGDFNASSLSCGYFERNGFRKRSLYSLTLNVKSIDAGGSHDKDSSSPILEKTESNSCQSRYVDLMVRRFYITSLCEIYMS